MWHQGAKQRSQGAEKDHYRDMSYDAGTETLCVTDKNNIRNKPDVSRAWWHMPDSRLRRLR